MKLLKTLLFNAVFWFFSILFYVFLFIFVDNKNILTNIMIPVLLIILFFYLRKTNNKKYISLKLFSILTIIIFFINFFWNLKITEIVGYTPSANEKTNILFEGGVNSYYLSKAYLTFSSIEKNNIIVYYPPEYIESAKKLIENISFLEETRKTYFSELTSKKTLSIVIYDQNKLRFGEQFNPNRSLGRYRNGTIQVFYQDNRDGLLVQSLVHEYVHFLIDEYRKENNMNNESIPIWFEEGLAEYIRCDYLNKEQGKCFKTEGLLEIPLNKLNTPSDWLKVKDVDSAYYSSYLEVGRLIKLKGENIINQF